MNTRTIACSFLLVAAPWTALAQVTFTKVNEGDVVHDLAKTAAVWADFNNDGLLDLYIAAYGGTNAFYRNDGNGIFTKITQGEPVQDADNHIRPAAADYDNDGNLDLLAPAGFCAPSASYTRLFRGHGDGTFSRSSGNGLTDQAGHFVGAWADFDNDGFLDLWTQNIQDCGVPVKSLLFHNNGDGTFTNAASSPSASELSVAFAFLWADYDNDGFMDLLIVNNKHDTSNLLYHNNRNGTFTRVPTGAIATDRGPENGNGGAWGDYDNDGFLDLFVTTSFERPNRLYHNNGDGTFTKITSGPMLSHSGGGDSIACAWGDFDNDGNLDLFVSNVGAKNGLYRNNGNGTFTQILSGSPADDGGPGIFSGGCSWVGYDNDGFLDLFVLESAEDGTLLPNLLYHNGGTTNAWIEVKCVGTVSNRSAVGAKVRVRATIGGRTFWQLREINEGSGYSSAPLIAHFGLGDATNADIVRIEWPSGIVQEFQGLAAKQIVTVSEPARLLVSMPNGIPQFGLKGGRGFQYQIETSTNLMTWSPIGTLTITNLSGTVQIIDTNTPASVQRFYRAVR